MPSETRSQALISVAMSVYNGARFLPQQLDSILAQQDVRIEVVAVDDGSSDDSVTVLNTYAARDPRVQVHINPANLGPTRSFERAMSLCRGDYLAPSDQDDIWHPAKLSRLLSAIGDHDVAYCDSAYVDDAGMPSGRRISDDVDMLRGTRPMQFVFANSVSGHAMLLRRDLFELARPIPPKLYYDWLLAMFAAARHGIVYVNEPLVQFRRHVHAFSALGKEARPKQASRNRIWIDERKLLLRAWADSRLDGKAQASGMLTAIERAEQGHSGWPLLTAIWKERASIPPGHGWPARNAIKLHRRMLRKLRRARSEADPPSTPFAL